jgi:hypothetical protein
LTRSNSFFWKKCPRSKKRSVIVLDLILLFELITCVVISRIIGLFLEVLLFATRVVVVLIILIATIVLAFAAIALVASMVVAVLATMMPVVQAMAASDRKMSRFLLRQLSLLLELSRTPATVLAVWHCSKKPKSQRGSMGIVLFVSANLN